MDLNKTEFKKNKLINKQINVCVIKQSKSARVSHYITSDNINNQFGYD